MNTKERAQILLSLYIIPIIFTLISIFLKDIQVNGEELAWMGRALVGFILGTAFEGILCVLGLTVAILFSRGK